MPFLFQDLAKRSVLLDLGLVPVVISCICYVTNIQYCNLLSANRLLKCGLLAVSFAFLWRKALFSKLLRSLVVRSTIILSGLILSRSSGAVMPSESAVLFIGLLSQLRRQTRIQGSHCLHVFLCAKVSDEYIVASCPLCDCLEDQSASFVVSCNVALDHIFVSAAPQEMAARVF